MIVYIIQNSNLFTYVGITRNLPKRIKQHRSGRTKSTANSGCLDYYIIYFWRTPKYSDASRLERFLHKQENSGIVELSKIISNYPKWNESLKQLVFTDRPITEQEILKDLEEATYNYKDTPFGTPPYHKPYNKPYNNSTVITNTRSLKSMLAEKRLFSLLN